MHITGKQVAIGLGIAAGAVGVGVLLAACSGRPKEIDPGNASLNLFSKFDGDGNNGIGANETERRTVYQPTTRDVNYIRIGDVESFTRQTIQETRVDSMKKAYIAAKGSDAFASWEELKSLANTFNTNGDATLSKPEQKAFEKQFDSEYLGSTVQVLSERQIIRQIETYPNNPGGGNGPTSPGDDGGYNPGNGPTSPGDDGGYNPGNGPTSPGDDGGGSNIPPSNGGSSGGDDGGYTPAPTPTPRPTPAPTPAPTPGNGNSTDNGDPSEGDF